jgi:hypothetical protein
MDLTKDDWPFGESSIGGIINVHFYLPRLFPFYAASLLEGGFLLFESIPGHGLNYLDLPKAGELRSALDGAFQFEIYREVSVGPSGFGAVTVQLLARRRPHSSGSKS